MCRKGYHDKNLEKSFISLQPSTWSGSGQFFYAHRFWFQRMLTESRGAHRGRKKAVMQNGESETQPMISSMTSLKPTVFFFLLRTIRQVTRSLVIVEFKYTFK
jgi:hypothetical protein